MGYLPGKRSAGRAASSTYSSGLGVLLSGTTVNVKGSYVEVIAATDSPVGFIIVELQPAGVAIAQGLVDIAVGGSGQEHIILSNLGVSSGTGFSIHSIAVPCSIPTGTRIAARYQRSNASLTMRCAIKTFSPMGLERRSAWTTYGATTATSRGTSIDPGGSANTKGSYVQMTAATDRVTNWMLAHIGNQANSARTDAQYVMDIATGAAASETVIIPNLGFSMDDTADEPSPNYIGPFPVSIPTGSRLAARAACTTNDATDRLFDVILYGAS